MLKHLNESFDRVYNFKKSTFGTNTNNPLNEDYNVREYSDMLYDMVEDGTVDAKSIAEDLIYWCSEDNIKRYMEVNELISSEEEDLTESRSADLPTTEGTVANILAQRMGELKDIDNVNDLKSKLIQIVKESNIADKAAAKQFLFKLNKCYNRNAVLSTIASYMTGIKTGDTYK